MRQRSPDRGLGRMLTTQVKKWAGIRWQWTPAQEAALLAELEAEGVPGFGGCPAKHRHPCRACLC